MIEFWFYLAATLILIAAMALILARLLNGPTLYDRALAANSFGAKTVLFLCLYGFITDHAFGVDIALLYALINFIATIAVLKFFRYRALDVALAPTTWAELREDLHGEKR